LNETANPPRQFILHGVTTQGRTFRPSDWAERLCGVMACYRPGGMAGGRDAYIGYSPYVRPMTLAGVKCVVLDERLRDIERMAFDFVMNFGRDNDLLITEACLLPEPRGDSASAAQTHSAT
jgi:hypothetical protein